MVRDMGTRNKILHRYCNLTEVMRKLGLIDEDMEYMLDNLVDRKSFDIAEGERGAVAETGKDHYE